MAQQVGRPKEIKAREYLTGQALAGILTQDWVWNTRKDKNGCKARLTEKELANKAVRIADHTLEALKGKNPR